MLTIGRDCGLMRSVARIAQSVEQGIENPRVLGSIPSPGTTIQRTQPMAGFLLFCVYKSLLCILVSLCRGIVRSALPDGGFALSGLLKRKRSAIGLFCAHKAKNPAPYGTGFF